ncbi:unnamed protein product [Ambrosiozyma monospora]|uniref:Unnamed protein product n=1 Tax=Ambrosiozyma monospora TaxID=43982 RepID=A0A9W6Z5R2_AMBMO|nr:unnamed protein product [Ambrosiozyma monospora]
MATELSAPISQFNLHSTRCDLQNKYLWVLKWHCLDSSSDNHQTLPDLTISPNEEYKCSTLDALNDLSNHQHIFLSTSKTLGNIETFNTSIQGVSFDDPFHCDCSINLHQVPMHTAQSPVTGDLFNHHKVSGQLARVATIQLLYSN